MGWNTKGGSSSNVDATARANAAAALAKIGTIYKVGGDKIAAGDEVFVVMQSGNIINWQNSTAAEITVPAAPTIANMKAAGLKQLSGNIEPQDIIETWQTQRSAWTANAKVDFTTAEPALLAGNVNKIYWSSKTGAGSTSTALTFDKDDLYEVYKTDAGTYAWREYVPQENWSMTSGARTYIYTSGAWVAQIDAGHEHPKLVQNSTGTHFYAYNKKLYVNIVANPNYSLIPTDAGWSTTWAEYAPPTAGIVYKAVADNDTLAEKEFSVASPALNVVHHLAFPPVSKDSWFSVINTGKGIIEVGGLGGIQILGEGQLEYTASLDGLSWVLTSKEGAVDIKEIGTGAALPANNSTFSMFILKGHSVLPDSVYWFDAGNSNQWVQV